MFYFSRYTFKCTTLFLVLSINFKFSLLLTSYYYLVVAVHVCGEVPTQRTNYPNLKASLKANIYQFGKTTSYNVGQTPTFFSSK